MAHSDGIRGRRVDSPYPGPRPFERDEESRFFGRKEESSELGYLVAAHPAVLLYAQSGAGKTSLLNAGLRPILTKRDLDVLPLARVGSPAPPNVDAGRIGNIFAFNAIMSWLGQEDTPEEAGEVPDWMLGAALTEGLSRIPRRLDDVREPVTRVLIFDQFEEIFYAWAERWQERHVFFEQVAATLEADNRLRALFAIREEYLASFDNEAILLPEAVRTRFRLERLRQPAARAAVEEPLESTGVRFDQGVAAELVKDLLKVQIEDAQGRSIAVAGEFVEPVQLQLVCQNLFDHIPLSDKLITMDLLHAFANADEALRTFYEQALVNTIRETGISEAELRSWFEQQLITPALTRGTVFRGAEKTGGIPNEAVAVLEKYHLIRAEYRSGSRWYELTHDRFIHPIQKSNQEWKSEHWPSGFEAQYKAAIRKAETETGVTKDALMEQLLLILPQNERVHLLNLAQKRTAGYKGNHPLRDELRRLRFLGLIRMRAGQQVGLMKDGLLFDLDTYVELTELGKHWVTVFTSA